MAKLAKGGGIQIDFTVFHSIASSTREHMNVERYNRLKHLDESER